MGNKVKELELEPPSSAKYMLPMGTTPSWTKKELIKTINKSKPPKGDARTLALIMKN